MSKLLYVVGSPRGAASRSGAIADAYLAALRPHDPEPEVDAMEGRSPPSAREGT